MSSLSPPTSAHSHLMEAPPHLRKLTIGTAGLITADLGVSTAVKSIAVQARLGGAQREVHSLTGSKWWSSCGGHSLRSSPSLWSLVEDDRHVAKALSFKTKRSILRGRLMKTENKKR